MFGVWFFLIKLFWGFGLEENNLWRRVLVEKFGVELGGGAPNLFEGRMGVVFGRALCRVGMITSNMWNS